jgi:site-specific DNA-methyltransferase (adenine-specific)
MKTELIAIEKLTPYANNPRRNEGAVAKVAESIRAFGFRQPIVVDGEGVVIVGHTRLLAARALGLTEAPVHVADLSAEQARAYRLADNRLAEIAEWDKDLLAVELADLKALGSDLQLLGFEDDEVAKLLGAPEGLTDPDEAPERPAEPVTRAGDVWVMGPHRLLCGDATKQSDLERLLAGGLADMTFADPPYNVAYEGGAGATRGRRKRIANDALGDAFFAFLSCATTSSTGPRSHRRSAKDRRITAERPTAQKGRER